MIAAKYFSWMFCIAACACAGAALASARVPYVARGGESLWLVGAASDTPIWKLLTASGLGEAEVRALPRGTRIALPRSAEGLVVPTARQVAARQRGIIERMRPTRGAGIYLLGLGETLWDVSLRFDVRLGRLMDENRLDDEDLTRLRFETPIALPGIAQSEIAQPGARPPRGVIRAIRKGRSLWDLAREHQVGVSEILAANRLTARRAERLGAGTRVFVPAVEASASGGTSRLRSRRQRALRGEADRLGLGDMTAASRLYRGRARAAWIRAAGPAALMDGTLQWPVRKGHFVRGYGSGEDDYHLAVDIAAPVGAKVRAAAPGITAFADRGIDGYGNMIFLVHPGGWITMYAHNSALHVVPGERVARGDVIAEVGSTGLARGPHVHFELLYGGENCDPAPLFRPAVQLNDGARRSLPEQVAWSPGAARPEAIRCAPRRHISEGDRAEH